MMDRYSEQSIRVHHAAPEIMKTLISLANEKRFSKKALCKLAGVTVSAFNSWNKPNATRRVAKYENLEACFNVLGYTLKPVKKD